MSARTKARKRALDVLFECDLRGSDAIETLARHLASADPTVPEYTVTLVEGVVAHRSRIDELVENYALGWTLDRMPVVDRNLLRIAAFELLWVDDTPDGVVLSEAVNLARDLSTDDSPTFVNGVLAKLLEEKPSLVV
ncbi:MAG: transcription antitermination protein NusB [Actinomycetota bacterium]|jgi:transcription antitermination protein NusB|nr:transcription antitermination protein NusB [Actinomycetota bacterium]